MQPALIMGGWTNLRYGEDATSENRLFQLFLVKLMEILFSMARVRELELEKAASKVAIYF